MTPLSIGSCAEDSDAYLIAFHPSQTDLSAGNDQTSPTLIQAVEDTDYKTNEIEQNLNSLMNALTYVSGYLLRKCLIQHSYPICHHNFVTKDVNDSSLCYSACLRPLTFEGISSAGGLTIRKETFLCWRIHLCGNSCTESIKNIGSLTFNFCSQIPKLHGT